MHRTAAPLRLYTTTCEITYLLCELYTYTLSLVGRVIAADTADDKVIVKGCHQQAKVSIIIL